MNQLEYLKEKISHLVKFLKEKVVFFLIIFFLIILIIICNGLLKSENWNGLSAIATIVFLIAQYIMWKKEFEDRRLERVVDFLRNFENTILFQQYRNKWSELHSSYLVFDNHYSDLDFAYLSEKLSFFNRYKSFLSSEDLAYLHIVYRDTYTFFINLDSYRKKIDDRLTNLLSSGFRDFPNLLQEFKKTYQANLSQLIYIKFKTNNPFCSQRDLDIVDEFIQYLDMKREVEYNTEYINYMLEKDLILEKDLMQIKYDSRDELIAKIKKLKICHRIEGILFIMRYMEFYDQETKSP